MQVVPIKSVLKALGSMLLKLIRCDGPPSNVALNFNLHRYIKASGNAITRSFNVILLNNFMFLFGVGRCRLSLSMKPQLKLPGSLSA